MPEVRELLGVGIDTFDEVFQVFTLAQHIVQTPLEKLIGQSAAVIDENLHHLFEVFNVWLAINALDQLDAFSWHWHKRTGPAGTTTHQDQLPYPFRVVQCEGHSGVATHGVTYEVDAIQP
ncbi:hypothetical protein D3C84_712760 [compost metagenome]